MTAPIGAVLTIAVLAAAAIHILGSQDGLRLIHIRQYGAARQPFSGGLHGERVAGVRCRSAHTAVGHRAKRWPTGVQQVGRYLYPAWYGPGSLPARAVWRIRA